MWGKVGHPAEIEKSPLNCLLSFAILGFKLNKVKYY